MFMLQLVWWHTNYGAAAFSGRALSNEKHFLPEEHIDDCALAITGTSHKSYFYLILLSDLQQPLQALLNAVGCSQCSCRAVLNTVK